MANPEHLEILKQGVEVWNRWRGKNPDIQPDLRGMNLSEENLTDINFREAILQEIILHNTNLYRADLVRASVYQADLYQTDLYRANLYKADLHKTNLNKARLYRVNLYSANLSQANLVEADLRKTDCTETNFSEANLNSANLGRTIFSGTILNGANLNRAQLEHTIFGSTDLSMVKGLDNIQHIGPSIIGVDTLHLSHGQIPEVFLRSAGIPSELIDYLERIKSPECPYTCEQLDEWIITGQNYLDTIHLSLNLLKEKKAKYGLDVPLHIEHQIYDYEREWTKANSQLVEYQNLRTLFYS